MVCPVFGRRYMGKRVLGMELPSSRKGGRPRRR